MEACTDNTMELAHPSDIIRCSSFFATDYLTIRLLVGPLHYNTANQFTVIGN